MLSGESQREPHSTKPAWERRALKLIGRGKTQSRKPSFPNLTDFRKTFLVALEVRLRRAASQPGLPLQVQGEVVHAIDWNESTPGRRPSGARLYHRGSRFGEPERRKLDRNLIARILYLAEALDRRTREKGQHGGVLKAKGLDVLRALLRRFYCHTTGECYPSFDAIAEAAGCCRATVAKKIAVLAGLGFLEVIRRKVVESFVDRARRIRIAVPLQTSNSYVFNFALADRAQHGDLALPLFVPVGNVRIHTLEHRGSKNWSETSKPIKNTMPPDLLAALEGLKNAIDGAAAAR